MQLQISKDNYLTINISIVMLSQNKRNHYIIIMIHPNLIWVEEIVTRKNYFIMHHINCFFNLSTGSNQHANSIIGHCVLAMCTRYINKQ